ncbi:MAG: DUF4859 domain-containing protein [Prevotella sp.]|nr:DUF4859 domain-containing protein [Prevotella sp.]
MRHHILLISALLMLSSSSAMAQKDSLWAKKISDTRFYENQVFDISDVDSIDFNASRIRFKKDGKTTAQAFSTFEYFSFRNPGQTLYCPAEFRSMDWNDEASEWCFQRSMESDHFIVFWQEGFGLDPTKAARGYAFDPNLLLSQAEEIYKVNSEELGFSRLGSSYTLDHYKHMLFVRYQTEWLATGSGYDDKIGAFWCNPAAVNDRTTLAHELGHTFQYLVRCDLGPGRGWRQGFGPNGEGGNMYWESCAQWQSARVYTEGIFSGWGSSYPGHSYMNLLHEEPRYENYYHQYYWCQLHGQDFVGRLWMATKGKEDPVDTYKRITERTQDEFCDDMFEYARRCPTWDMDGIRELGKNYRDRFSTRIQDNEEGWIEPQPGNCPENYGFNVMRMTVPNGATTVSVRFRGEAGKEGYRALNTELAGWRYGFVALGRGDKRTYSEIGRAKEGTLDFDVPEGTRNLWFVAMGAPTEHFHHVWDDNNDNDEQWPYAVDFQGTDVKGHVKNLKELVPHDTTIVVNTYNTYEAEKELSGTYELDITPIRMALACTATELQITPQTQDTIRVYTEEPDGTLCDVEVTPYAYYFFYDAEGNVIKAESIADGEEKGSYYAMYASYGDHFLIYYGELNGKHLNKGDSHTFPIAFQRTLDDGTKVTARVLLNVIME